MMTRSPGLAFHAAAPLRQTVPASLGQAAGELRDIDTPLGTERQLGMPIGQFEKQNRDLDPTSEKEMVDNTLPIVIDGAIGAQFFLCQRGPYDLAATGELGLRKG